MTGQAPKRVVPAVALDRPARRRGGERGSGHDHNLAGFFGNSYALIADGIASTSDIVWGGLRVSVAPADERHLYGYGKAEALSGSVASLTLLAAAAMIAFQCVREISTPHHLPHWSTLLVLVRVVATKMILARWMGDIGEESESTSLQPDAWHH